MLESYLEYLCNVRQWCTFHRCPGCSNNEISRRRSRPPRTWPCEFLSRCSPAQPVCLMELPAVKSSRNKRYKPACWPLRDTSQWLALRGSSFIASRIGPLPRTVSPSFLSFSSSLCWSKIGLFEILVRLLINARVRAVDPRIKELRESCCKIFANIESCRALGLTNTTYSTA